MADKLHERIQQARLRNGWTQAQVAKWANVTPEQLSRWESGLLSPSAENLGKLARGLRVSTDWLLGLENAR